MIGQAVNNSRSRRNSHVGNRRVGGDHCPYCGAPISAAVRARIAAAEQAQVAKAEESLRSQFSRERAEAEKKTRLAIEAARKDGAKAAAKAKTEAIASERSKFIREKLKFEEQLQQMRRRLENKTPNEFGEEGELL